MTTAAFQKFLQEHQDLLRPATRQALQKNLDQGALDPETLDYLAREIGRAHETLRRTAAMRQDCNRIYAEASAKMDRMKEQAMAAYKGALQAAEGDQQAREQQTADAIINNL